MGSKDFIVECNVCGQRYKNHVGSTECCASIAYIVDKNGKKTTSLMMYAQLKESEDEQ